MGSISGWGRSPGGRNVNPFQYSCLENPMDTGAWQATVHGVQTVAHDLVTKQQSPPLVEGQEYILGPDKINFEASFLI